MTVPDDSQPLLRARAATAEGVTLRVRAQPGARRNRVIGVREDEIMISVASQADRGRANEAIVKLLAKSLGIARNRINLIAGKTNRHKRFCVLEAGLDGVQNALSEALAETR